MKKILIIGSGPVGAICADFITTSKKFNIELMDVAVSSRTKYKLKSDGLIPYKNINGNDFMYKRRDNLKFIFDKFTNFLTSHAQGGLSNVWGGNISALHNTYLKKWGVSKKVFNESFKYVLNRVPIYSNEDMIDDLYDIKIKSTHPLTSKNDFHLSKVYKYKNLLKSSNFYIGRSKLALNINNKRSSFLSDFSWDNQGLVFNSKQIINLLASKKKISYNQGKIILRFKEIKNKVRVEYLDLKINQRKYKYVDKLIIAAGCIDSTLIIKNSLEPDSSYKFNLKESKKFYFPVFSLLKPVNKFKFSLSHFFIQENSNKRSTHSQLYPLKDAIEYSLAQNFGKFSKLIIWPFTLIINHFYLCMTYIDSDNSGVITVQKDGNTLTISGKENFKSIIQFKQFFKKFRSLQSKTYLFPFKFIIPSKLGHSQHFGGSLPMSKIKSHNRTDFMGRPFNMKNVHVVDSTILPSIPATPTTFVCMANAVRIMKGIL